MSKRSIVVTENDENKDQNIYSEQKSTEKENESSEKIEKDETEKDDKDNVGLVLPQKFKIFHFYYHGTQQILKVYMGTPLDLIFKTLFQLLGILLPGASNLQSLMDNISLLDSDGCPVVFSPDHIPHGEKLYLQLNVSVPPPIITTITTQKTSLYNGVPENLLEFSWNSEWNSLYCGYKLSEANRTITTGNPTPMSSMPILISNRSFKKGTGIFKWRVVFKEELSYHCAGIISAEEASSPIICAQYGTNFNSVPWFQKTSSLGQKNTVIILDTNKSNITINGVTHEGLPDTVYAAVCFKMPHEMQARLLFDVI